MSDMPDVFTPFRNKVCFKALIQLQSKIHHRVCMPGALPERFGTSYTIMSLYSCSLYLYSLCAVWH